MSKITSKFVCQQCGYESSGWMGKCPNCGSWNSLVETVTQVSKSGRVSKASDRLGVKPIKLEEVSSVNLARQSSGLEEFNRVLGGGIVKGSVILLAGEPGIGKSTLLLQLAANIAKPLTSHLSPLTSVFYISGEESPGQIKIRAQRLGIDPKSPIFFINETNVDRVIEALEKLEVRSGKLEDEVGSEKWEDQGNQKVSSQAPTSHLPPPTSTLVIIDSIQTMWTEDLTGTPGSVGQVRECAGRLLRFAKSHDIPLFFVGHVNKEGAIAGPMVLSHLVDAVLLFEGERFQTLRILRAVKNRFGPTDEVGVFSMEEKGLKEVANPSDLFLTEKREKVPGSVIAALMEGTRPLLIEVQALAVPTQLAIPRRVGTGIDSSRLQLLVAVLGRRAGLALSNFDIFVNIVGGIKISEPAADLAICLAIASSFKDVPIDNKVCAVGEVGLLGEIRNVSQIKKRAQEAKRLGYSKTITPEEVGTVREAIQLLLK